MDRLACVDLRALPLQLLLLEHPDWADHPTAVVEQDRPQGVILSVNERARRRRILPGTRYAEGLSRAADLRAAVVPRASIASAVRRVTAHLRRFSPNIEPGRVEHEPGLFWLDAAGLARLHPSLAQWGQEIVRSLSVELGLRATVAVGFSRFGSYAVARSTPPGCVRACADPAQEQTLARAVALDRLALAPRLRQALHRLGVDTVEALVRLPPGGLLERFGPEAHALRALAAGERHDPLQPEPELPQLCERLDLDQPEPEASRLLFLIKRRLHRLLCELACRGQALAALRLVLELEVGWRPDAREQDPRQQHTLRPAEPTLDGAQLSDLIRLRLEAIVQRGELGRGVTAVELAADGITATREQLQLFARRPRRDLAAANRALARLRAELGQQAVVRAVLRDRHLPEGRFSFEPLERLEPPHPTDGTRVLVRRLLPAHGASQPQQITSGPFILSGGWWRGDEVHREYHYARTSRGDLLWLYRERSPSAGANKQGRWVLQGRVE